MGKKILVGCGVLLLIGMVGVGACSAFMYSKGKELVGDLIGHTQLATQMPLERMEQEALRITPAQLVEKLMDYSGQPVEVEGVSTTLDRASGQAPPPNMDTGNTLVIEPGVMVTALEALPQGARTPGNRVRLLGIASHINLQKQVGKPLVVIIARRVEVIPGTAAGTDAPPPLEAAPSAADAGRAPAPRP